LSKFQEATPGTPTPTTARAWAQILSKYRDPSNRQGIFEIAVTIVPFVALWIAAAALVANGYWIGLALTLPAAVFLVRLFMIQHDCGHGSFFSHQMANDWIGRVFGVLTFTPYSFWQRNHALHHASSGCLDHRGFGEIETITVDEYRSRSIWARARYRAYRHPLVMFGIGPTYLFLLDHRLPMGMMRRGWQPWISTMGTNVAIFLAAGALIWLIGFKLFVLVQLPIIVFAATIGVWLFFVQHQFEQTSWEKLPEWKRQEAALHGSSHYDLPVPLQWLTGNIGVHHVHHLCSRIPYYRLQRVLKNHPELRNINRLTLRDSLRTVRLALWDNNQKRLVSFRDFHMAH
jgi:omega-6 fatty acid desaturase (delta-12 desaturase)